MSQTSHYVHKKNDIFVGNIAHGTTDEQLKEVFSEAGRVVNIRQVTDRETGTPRGFAFIEFEDIASCESAIRNVNGYELNGRALGVNYSKRSNVQDSSSQHESSGFQRSSSPSPPQIPKTIATVLETISLREMYEIMANMKQFVEKEPEKARLMLISYPNVTEALLGMQIKLGMSSQEEADQMKITLPIHQKTAQSVPGQNGPMQMNSFQPEGMAFHNDGFSPIGTGGPVQMIGSNIMVPIPQQMNSFNQPQLSQPSMFPQQSNIQNTQMQQMNSSNGMIFHAQQPPPQNFQGNQQQLGQIQETCVIPGVERGMFVNNTMNQSLGPVPPDLLNQVMNMTPQMLATLPMNKQQQIIELQNHIGQGSMPMQQPHRY